MSNLTLVELAQALESEKKIELRSFKDVGDGAGTWTEHLGLRAILSKHLDYPEDVRIKPEPREYWLVNGASFFTLAQARKAATGREFSIYHAVEVLE